MITSIAWNGLKIDKDFKVWQEDEEPVDICQIPYQFPQPLLTQVVARDRTNAVWYWKNDHTTRGIREIGKEVSKTDPTRSLEEKGILGPPSLVEAWQSMTPPK